VTKPREDSGRFTLFMKWVGIASALLAFGSALYGIVHAEAGLRERGRTVAEQLAAARSQQAAGDYPAAWESLQRASAIAEVDGMFAKLLGGLGAQRRSVRAAQEDLAMEWIRGAHAPEGHNFSEIADRVTPVLVQGAHTSTGARRADLLAHLGWAYFLKQRDGNSDLRPDLQYREAVAADATNPYANAFWGHFVIWTNGPLSEAKQRFAAALTTTRARAVVRHFQLAALGNSHAEDVEAEWWRVVDEMHRQGEPLDAGTRDKMESKYYFALDDQSQMKVTLSAIPASEHVELQRMLLQSGDFDSGKTLTITAAMAVALEAAGRKDEALAAWQEVRASAQPQVGSTLERQMNAALKRLGAHPQKGT